MPTKPLSEYEFPLVSVYRRKDHSKAWTAQWRDPLTGKKEKKLLSSVGYATKADAEAWLRDLSNLLLERKRQKTLGRTPSDIEAVENGQLPLVQVIEEYKKTFGEPTDAIVSNLESRLRPFCEWLNGPGSAFALGRDFNKFAMTKFRDWLQKLKKQRALKNVKKRGAYAPTDKALSATTRNIYRAAAITFLNWARRRNYISMAGSDITEACERFKQETTLPQSLRPVDLKKLLAEVVACDGVMCLGSRHDKRSYYTKQQSTTASPRYAEQAPLFLLLLLTGQRLNEALHLKWDNVDFERGTLHIRSDPSSGWKVKTRQERMIPLQDSPALQQLLKTLAERPEPGDYVIKGLDGHSPRQFHRPSWDRFADKAKLPNATPKLLRSTFASCLAMGQGGPQAWQLSKRMGHSVEVAERHYVAASVPRPGTTVEDWLGVGKEVHVALAQVAKAKSHQHSTK